MQGTKMQLEYTMNSFNSDIMGSRNIEIGQYYAILDGDEMVFIEVQNISDETILAIDKDKLSRTISLDDLMPIPLTEELLIGQFEFKKRNDHYKDPQNTPYYRLGHYVIVAGEKDVKVTFNLYIENMEAPFGYCLKRIDYFHELQSLLKNQENPKWRLDKF